ncbi:MAG: TIGR01777 family oxidoreductase [Myxococcaceae bacterium]
MKVAVTGGTGFVGRPLVSALQAQGHEVCLLTRHPERVSAPMSARHFDALAQNPNGLLDGIDAVVHLSGEPVIGRFTSGHRARVLESRVNGTRAIAAAAVASQSVRTLVSASGVGYYGARGAEWLSETAAPGNDFLAQVCVAWEGASETAERAGIRTVRLRIGAALHPDGGKLRAILPVFRLGLGGPLGSGEQYVSWIHRDDFVALVLHALQQSHVHGAYNAVAPAPLTDRDFARTLGHVLRRPTFLKVPSLALRLALGELADVVLAGQRCSAEKVMQSGFVHRYAALDTALRAFTL